MIHKSSYVFIGRKKGFPNNDVGVTPQFNGSVEFVLLSVGVDIPRIEAHGASFPARLAFPIIHHATDQAGGEEEVVVDQQDGSKSVSHATGCIKTICHPIATWKGQSDGDGVFHVSRGDEVFWQIHFLVVPNENDLFHDTSHFFVTFQKPGDVFETVR